jgi:hypothetical protein
MFVGAICVDVAVAFACCLVGALWLDLCDWPAEADRSPAVPASPKRST